MATLVGSRCKDHTVCPEGYIAWHAWAARMGKTHRQLKCDQCGLWTFWIPKGTKVTTRRDLKIALDDR
jgi:hypothetical protein